MKTKRGIRRFYSPSPIPKIGEGFYLSTEETRHLRDTLRLGTGDTCLITDGAGHEARAVIRHFSRDRKAYLAVESVVFRKPQSAGPRLRFFVACPQKHKMDFLVEKFQELGVQELRPLETARTVVKMTAAAKAKAVARWQKIAREASKQSGAPLALRITEPVALDRALAAIPQGETTALFHPAAGAVPFREWLGEGSEALNLFIGPEGGFTEGEVAQARGRGLSIVALTETILKVDTAALAVASAVRLLAS